MGVARTSSNAARSGGEVIDVRVQRLLRGVPVDEVVDSVDISDAQLLREIEEEVRIEALRTRAYEADETLELDLDAALNELRTKDHDQIERETAVRWAARSVAAMTLGRPEESSDYRHEALEHAAQVSGDFVDRIALLIDEGRRR